jgi:hypothetical protein
VGLFVLNMNALADEGAGSGRGTPPPTPTGPYVSQAYATAMAGSILARETDPIEWKDQISATCSEPQPEPPACIPEQECPPVGQSCALDAWQVSFLLQEETSQCPDGSTTYSKSWAVVDGMFAGSGNISYFGEAGSCPADGDVEVPSDDDDQEGPSDNGDAQTDNGSEVPTRSSSQK